jgi:hypothetical protein
MYVISLHENRLTVKLSGGTCAGARANIGVECSTSQFFEVTGLIFGPVSYPDQYLGGIYQSFQAHSSDN